MATANAQIIIGARSSADSHPRDSTYRCRSDSECPIGTWDVGNLRCDGEIAKETSVRRDEPKVVSRLIRSNSNASRHCAIRLSLHDLVLSASDSAETTNPVRSDPRSRSSSPRSTSTSVSSNRRQGAEVRSKYSSSRGFSRLTSMIPLSSNS
jgi:hypothetical protein